MAAVEGPGADGADAGAREDAPPPVEEPAVEPPRFEPFRVSVSDLFDQPSELYVKKPKWLCRPVVEDVTETAEPERGLLCYKARRPKDGEKFSKVHGIHIDNALGPLRLKAKAYATRAKQERRSSTNMSASG